MMPENIQIHHILNTLPNGPGIYKMLDQTGRVIYVGKAKDIKKRVRQYFQPNYEHSTRTRKLLEMMKNIEAIEVDSELEAMILETNLIKQLQPKYNVLMKDDKNYVYIKITRDEDFPRIQIVRRIENDNAKYIGPKTAAHKVKETFSILKKIFPFRHCDLDIELLKEKPKDKSGKAKHDVKITHKVLKYPCLHYFIKKCVAPCIGLCTIAEYREVIKNVENFLEGKSEEIMRDLYGKMNIFAQNKEFEKAARMRDKIKKVQSILEKQKVSDPNQEDKDIINYCIVGGNAYFNLFQIRDGKLIGQENFTLSAQDIEENENQEVLEAFLKQYYKLTKNIPKEILIPHEIEDSKKLEDFIHQETNLKSRFLIPQKGTKNKLLEMSLNNARIFADRNRPSWQIQSLKTEKAVEELRQLLKIEKPLKRIECYDISHLSGTNTVGSMIVFEKGIPNKNHYRKFQIRTVISKPDDYKSMEEVLMRRFSKLTEKLQSEKYKFRKAGKKDTEFIEKNNKIKVAKTDRQFYILEANKKPLGFIAIKEYSNKIAELTDLWVLKRARGQKLGYKLIKGAISKIKAKRIYCICNPELKDYYALVGFQEIRQLPPELQFRYKRYHEPLMMAYDKIKYKEDQSFSQTPNLILIDGGKGQLSVATKVLTQLKIKIPHAALAKQLEEIFTPNSQNSIILAKNSEALKLLQRARDEAHRFAITYNRKLRSKIFQK